MSFAERVSAAAAIAAEPLAYFHCKLRGEIVGERLCRTCGDNTRRRPVRSCPYHPEGVVIVQECKRCLRVVPDPTKRIARVAPEEANDGDEQFVTEGPVKRWNLPSCEWRGEVLDSREVECCGGMIRIDERFPCRHPENAAGVAFSKMCSICEWDKAADVPGEEGDVRPDPRPESPNTDILLAIGFYAGDGTATTRATFEDKLAILGRCLESVRAAGPGVTPVLLVTGDRAAADRARERAGGIETVWLGGNPGHQQGEAAIGRAAVAEAQRLGAGWIVKVAGDTFHPRPGWARALVDLGASHDAALVATVHHVPGRVNTQVYAVQTAFADRTFPHPQDPRLGTQGIEPTWGDNVRAAGGAGRWHVPAATRLTVDGAVNFAPAEPEVTYTHAHTAARAAAWRMARPGSGEPTLSIVLPSRNEEMLLDTVRSVRETSREAGTETEIVVVDDASNAPVDAADCGPGVRVLRNPVALGVDPSRNVGIGAARGDVVGILDAHMRVETQAGEAIPGGLQRLAREAWEREAIVVGRCAHIEIPKHNGPQLCGGSFVKITNDRQVVGMQWNHDLGEGVHRINGLLGASYFAPRHVWERLGGFVDACLGWGYSEEGLALKAFFLGVPIYYCGDVTVSHLFRAHGPHPFPLDGAMTTLNRARILAVAFEPETFADFWLPRIRQHAWSARFEKALQDPPLLAESARFRAKKVRSDDDALYNLFGVTP